MKFPLLTLGMFLFVGCGTPEPQPEPKSPSEMTEAERKEEIQKILDKIGVKLPENWESMSKQERGKFLLPYLMQADLEN